MVLSRRPLCSDPFKVHEQNSVVLATDVHHIVPLSSDRPRRELNAESNLMPLCHSCHSRITATGGKAMATEGEGVDDLWESPQRDRRPSFGDLGEGFEGGGV